MLKKIAVFFRWCAFLFVLATIVAAGVAYRRAETELRRIVRAELRAKFPRLETSFESVRLDATRGVRIYSVAWRRPDSDPNAKPLLAAEELYVECPIDWKSISAGNFRPQRIVVTRPQLRTRPQFDALVADFCALQPVSGAQSCPIEIYDGAVLFDENETNAKNASINNNVKTAENAPNDAASEPQRDELDVFDGATAFAGFRVNLTPTPRTAIGGPPKLQASVDATSENVESPRSPQTAVEFASKIDEKNAFSADVAPDAPENDVVWRLDLRVSNPYVKELRVRGLAAGPDWSAQGSVDSLDVAPLLDVFKTQIDKRYNYLSALRGQTSFDFETANDKNAPLGVRFRIDGQIARGAAVLPILKFPLSDVDLKFSATENSVSLEKAAARCGATVLTAAYRQSGSLVAPTNAKFRVRLEDFPLDDALLKNLARRLDGRSDQIALESTLENSGADLDSIESPKIRSLIKFLNDYQFSATTNADLTVEKSPQTANRWTPTNVAIDGENLSLVCLKFPYRLDGLAGRVSLDRAETLTIDLGSAFNERKLKIAGKFETALSDPRGGVAIEGLGYPIDAKLLSALPESNRAEIARLRPSGTIDADVRISFVPERSEPLRIKTSIGVRDASIQYDKFPLPISSIGGLIKLEDGAWFFSNLSGKSGAARLRASGSLVPGKTFDKIARFQRLRQTSQFAQNGVSPQTAPTRFIPQTFASPQNAPTTQSTSFQPQPADFVDSDAPSALLSSLTPPPGAPLPPNAWRFELTTDVEDFPLGDELRAALVEYDGRETIEQIRLTGKANGQIRLAYRTDDRKLDLEFDAEPVAGSAAMKPDAFPYELKNLEGRVSYRAGELTVDGWRARNGATTISANVRSRFSPQTGWTFDLSPLRIDRFQTDRDLQSAAPSAALAFLERFKPIGYFNIDGALRITRGPASNAPVRAAWDVRIVAQQNEARAGVPLENVCGRVKLRGVAIENGPVALGGELDLDSFCWKDLQILNLVGPFYFDGRDFFWGREAPPPRQTVLYRDPFVKARIDADPLYRVAATTPIFRAQNGDVSNAIDAPGFAPQNPQTSSTAQPVRPRGGVLPSPNETASDLDGRRPIQAIVFNGQATTDGVIVGSEIPTYRTTLNLVNARLDDVSREFVPGAKPLAGRVAAFATLNGEGRNLATLKGKGGLSVQEAELYELPQIVKIFQILSVQEPDQTAFNSAFADFDVVGDRLKFNSVVLKGNALTLFGDGWLTVREKEKLIDLTLNSRLGDESSQIPVVSDLIGGAGDQLAQIRVEGNLSAPIVRQDRFPGVKKAWWSVFPDQEPTPTEKTPTERPRPFRDALRKLTDAASGGE